MNLPATDRRIERRPNYRRLGLIALGVLAVSLLALRVVRGDRSRKVRVEGKVVE